MKEIKLLLVDDQELIRESLHIVLDMEEDIEVVGLAENGRIAIEKCEQLQPDIVLMDIHMPEIDGVEATKKIKQLWPQIKIIFLTTFQELQYVIEGLGAGAEGYVLKAIHPKDLAAGVRLVCHGGSLIPQGLAKDLISQLSFQSHSGAATKSGEQETKQDYGLSERELQVLEALAHGLNNKEISEKLFLSEGTVKNYISNIYSKLDVRDRLQAAKKAQEEGIV